MNVNLFAAVVLTLVSLNVTLVVYEHEKNKGASFGLLAMVFALYMATGLIWSITIKQ